MDVRPKEGHWPDKLPAIAIAGAGGLGRDLAALAVRFGYEVRLVDKDQDALRGAVRHVEKRLRRFEQEGLLHAPVEPFLKLFKATGEMSEAVTGTALLVDAGPDTRSGRRMLLTEVGAAASGALVGTSCATCRLSDLTEGLDPKPGVVGLRLYSPVVTVPLAEVAPDGDAKGVTEAVQFGRGLGKDVVTLAKDSPGLVATRVLFALYAAAARAAQDQDPGAIDAAFRQLGFWQGPFESMDHVGLDLVSAMAEDMGQDVPAPLKERVAENKVGRRTGQGWFGSDGPTKAEPGDPWPALAPAILEAARIVREGVAPPGAVDRALRLGGHWPGGPFQTLAAKGVDDVVKALRARDLDAAPLEAFDLAPATNGLDIATRGDLTLVTLQQTGDPFPKPTLDLLKSTVQGAPGPVLIAGEGRSLMHPRAPPLPDDTLDMLRRRPTVALLHGHLGDGAMSIARACRRRVARIDTAIGVDRVVPATRALQLELIDGLAHPLSMGAAISGALRTLVSVNAREVDGLLAGG